MAFDAWKVEGQKELERERRGQQMDLIRIPGPEMNEMAAKRKGFPSLSETFRDGRNDSLITVAVCKQNSDFYRFSPMLARLFSFLFFFPPFLPPFSETIYALSLAPSVGTKVSLELIESILIPGLSWRDVDNLFNFCFFGKI